MSVSAVLMIYLAGQYLRSRRLSPIDLLDGRGDEVLVDVQAQQGRLGPKPTMEHGRLPVSVAPPNTVPPLDRPF